jgi:hypothetical protein
MRSIRYVEVFVSILEALYVLYMTNFFKTHHRINHPIQSILRNTTQLEPVDRLVHSHSQLCPMGKFFGVFLSTWLLSRFIVSQPYRLRINLFLLFNYMVCSICVNWNVYVYLMPIFILEFMWYKNNSQMP